jgi:predicted N-acetyltransferase YhbS
MEITFRSYNHESDYERVGRFLVRTHRATGNHINWLQPRWEYMHFHPLIREVDLRPIGIWEKEGEIVGVVHPEHRMGTVYIEVDPVHTALKGEMLEYAGENLAVVFEGARALKVFIDDSDSDFQQLAAAMDYVKTDSCEEMTRLIIPDPFPEIILPEGFHLKSLADDNDLWKVHCVLWRGFGHGDDPPEDELEDRKFMQSAPNFRKDLNIVVEAPDGRFAAYCGMWYEPVHRIAYVEPVATDPDFRRMGLGRAAVMEGVRRCGAEGATVAYVGSDLPIYLSIGFKRMYKQSIWHRVQ